MLISPLNLGVLTLIALIAVIGLQLNQRELFLFRRLRRELSQVEAGQPSARLQPLIDRYLTQARKGARLDPERTVTKFLTELTVPFPLLGLLPTLTVERLVKFAASAPILLGLGGNFIGWLIALGDLRTAWPQVGKDLQPAEMIGLLGALKQPLSGLNTAFVLSVAGLLCSFAVSFLTQRWSGYVERERFAAALVEHLESCAATEEAPGDLRDLMLKILDRLGTMADSVAANVGGMTGGVAAIVQRVDTTVGMAGELVQKMHPMADSISRAATAIEQMAARLDGIVGRLEVASGSFSGGAETLERGLGSFGEGIHRLAEAQEQSVSLLNELQSSTTNTLTNLAARLHGLEQVEEKLDATSTRTLEALQGLVRPVQEASAQLDQQYRALLRQSQLLEVSIGKMSASSDHLEQATGRMANAQETFVQELEANLVRANQAQIGQLLATLNDLNRLLQETQNYFVLQMNQTVGALAAQLSHPILGDLVQSLQKLVDSGRLSRA